MTTTEKINKKIAEWLGWKPNDSYLVEWWTGKELVDLPDFYHTNAAFDLLDVLVERGYVWIMAQDNKESTIAIYKQGELIPQLTMKAPTLQAAICEALVLLIEKENGNV